ncbi:hypothetical protein DPMN_152683 [Dreissena polymorpha]|uniref:Uncharacterized protein n=1 Tax=Dreissena polymorpha TaxID=45954 RepID=A0A9D4FMA6_DREPO|nr:hypothetical protein DPMN_152683 [Dreissena polymorpha]
MQTTILLTLIDLNGTAQLMNLETTSPGPSRFAIAGRPARTGMIRRYYLTRSHYVPVLPRLKPVNSPTESRALVVAGYAPRHGRAPVYRNSSDTHRSLTGIRPRQSYGNAPFNPDRRR